jgi:hypothetical protein
VQREVGGRKTDADPVLGDDETGGPRRSGGNAA